MLSRKIGILIFGEILHLKRVQKSKLLVSVNNRYETDDVDLTLITPLPIKDTTKIIPEVKISDIDKVEVTNLSGMGVNIKQMESYFQKVNKKHVVMNQLFWTYQKTKTTMSRIIMIWSFLELSKRGTGGLTGSL